MSVLTYPPVDEKEYIKDCIKECGIITTTLDCSYFALSCLFCNEKFIYFDSFIAHFQTKHTINKNLNEEKSSPSAKDLLPQSTISIKEEIIEDDSDDSKLILPVKDETMYDIETTEDTFNNMFSDSFFTQQTVDDDMDILDEDNDELDSHYDDLVEESLLTVNQYENMDDLQPHVHIKDRKMIKYLIDCYRQNAFMWDHRHKYFRDRHKRQEFLNSIMSEFKRKFNITLARDAVTRKWDNLRTVYKREITRMNLEKISVSTLWYFKELQFLNKLYDENFQLTDSNITENGHKRRYSAVWNDLATLRLLQMLKESPCFFDKFHADYHIKEKRAEALKRMKQGLQKYVDVNTIQISKRISQLRGDYAKQKNERLLCEIHKKKFSSSFGYYEAMQFMDDDIPPFKCDFCPILLHTVGERELHALQHPTNDGLLVCDICNTSFVDNYKFIIHKQTHWQPTKETKKYYKCEMCSATFLDKPTYKEHVKQHNNDLLLPSLNDSHGFSVDATPTTYACDQCFLTFTQPNELKQHCNLMHESSYEYKCDFSNCNKEFSTRHALTDHVRLHYIDEEFQCDICGKGFRTAKNLSNHRQIHDAVKRYICKICGSAFAQAAGLYLHKRRHNRSNSRLREKLSII